jgi:hypothetical protein
MPICSSGFRRQDAENPGEKNKYKICDFIHVSVFPQLHLRCLINLALTRMFNKFTVEIYVFGIYVQYDFGVRIFNFFYVLLTVHHSISV